MAFLQDGAKVLVNVAASVLLPSTTKATPTTDDNASAAINAAASSKVLLTADIDRDVAVKKAAESSYLKSNASATTTFSGSPYPEVWGIPDAYKVFNLGEGGLSSEVIDMAHGVVRAHVDMQVSRQLGYQCNQHINASKYASHYLDTFLNNLGDPFSEGNFTVNTKYMERAVLDYFARLWNAVEPHSKGNLESYWGFLPTMGSTEGNLYAMWNARDYLSGKKMLVDVDSGRVNSPQFVYHSAPISLAGSDNAYNPVLFGHSSFPKAAALLGLRPFAAEGSVKYLGQCPLRGTNGIWPAEVPYNDDGTMNIDALATLVDFFAANGHPIIVNFNYGTGFKGSYDDVARASKELTPILKRHGLYERKVQWNEEDPDAFETRSGFWFHVDGALGATFMPYVEMAHDNPDGPLIDKKGPVFDFRLPTVHSISTSGHKWPGAPMPTGVYMTKIKYQMKPPDIPDYIGTPDTMLGGSRNGLSAMVLWDNLARHSLPDQINKTLDLLKLADTAEAMLRHLQDDILKEDLLVVRSDLSLTIRFRRPNSNLCKKYSLSNQTIDGLLYSHIYIMEHVTEDMLNEFIEDLKVPGAFETGTTEASESTVISSIAKAKGLVAPSSNRLHLLSTSGGGFRS